MSHPQLAVPEVTRLFGHSRFLKREPSERPKSRIVNQLVLLFTSLLAIPLARQSCLDATLFARLKVVGVTLHFLDDVLLLYLPLEAAQGVL